MDSCQFYLKQERHKEHMVVQD